jgi:hypothetical protein
MNTNRYLLNSIQMLKSMMWSTTGGYARRVVVSPHDTDLYWSLVGGYRCLFCEQNIDKSSMRSSLLQLITSSTNE